MTFYIHGSSMRVFLLVLASLCSTSTLAQTHERFMVMVQGDLIRTDQAGFLTQLQAGAEAGYQIGKRWWATGGVEWWSGDGLMAVGGARYFPVDEAFIRLRGLIRQDIAVGGGFVKPLSTRLRFEAMTDYYIMEGLIAIRAGLAWKFRETP